MTTKCLIIGSGPAGYTAAIYTSRANISPLVIEGYQPGGQLTTTTEVENFPGYPAGVTGPQLMEDLRAQALKFGADIREGYVKEVDFSKRPFKVHTDNGLEIEAETIIISTGASAKYLGIDDEQKYNGMGVSACATCDGFFYRGRKVAVVGGGDTACEEALYLSYLASEVYLIVRRDVLRASKVMQRRVFEKENIHVLFNTVTAGLYGEGFVQGARLIENKGKDDERTYELPIDGFFLAIGHTPNTEVFRPAVECDEHGYIKVEGQGTATNVPGVFAAGDVADPTYRQAVTAAGMGCKAALDVERFLTEHAGN
ncbi:MAG: thioredoxin-disulfide reductase [Muribaculaceae bacterium]|nr:thioredoxin-disulfide reductase [Muribaculaceae bacterium]